MAIDRSAVWRETSILSICGDLSTGFVTLFGILLGIVLRTTAPLRVKRRPFTSAAFVLALTLAYAVGIWIGAALFSQVEARSFLRIQRCENTCLRPSEFAGLLASIGIQTLGRRLPLVVAETDKSIAFLHPIPEDDFHFVIVPKRDIQNIGTLEPDEEAYLVDAYALIQELIRTQKISKYRVVTNGPGYQKVAYLHFHLLGERE